MFSLFKSCRSMLSKHSRQFSTVKKFTLKDQNQSDGYLIKFSNAEKSADKLRLIKEEIRGMIKSYPNSMFIITTPTTFLSGEYGSFPEPGHNFALVSTKTTDTPHEENILSCMSKRPDTREILARRARAKDERFMSSYSPTVRSYNPRFTSFEEEMNAWEKKALSIAHYPLFLHIIPIKSELNIDAHTFQNNVKNIIEYNTPYTLHSSHHPTADHLIPPANCNGAIYEAIFGSGDVLIQNMFCQEAVMVIMKSFVKDRHLYEELAKEIGLTNGIKPSPIIEENYRPAFTC